MKSGVGDWVMVEVGETLEPNDIIKTGDNSKVVITFFEGSTIELEAGTQVEVAELELDGETGSTTIKLKQEIGKTLSRVMKLADPASRYEVETPAGVAAVRGSVMVVDVSRSGTTRVTNKEGNIWVIAYGVELKIPEGMKAIIYIDRPPRLILLGGGDGGVSAPPPPITAIALLRTAEPTEVHVGDNVTYTYTVTNAGDTSLSDVSVSDDKVSEVIYQSGDADSDGELDVGETWLFSGVYMVAAEDEDPLVSTANVSGTDASSQTVTAQDSISISILEPGIALVKTAGPTEVHVGDNITYTYNVTNDGNTPLLDVSVSDDKVSEVIYQSGDADGDNELDVGETWLFSGVYTVAADDEDPLVNTANVSGTDVLSQTVTAQDSASVSILEPGITLVKTAEVAGARVGDNVTYTYTVTNAGDTPLLDVSVSDDKVENVIYQSGDADSDGELDVGETWLFSGVYTVAADDEDPLVNTANVSGTDVLSQTVTAQDSASVTNLSNYPQIDVQIDTGTVAAIRIMDYINNVWAIDQVTQNPVDGTHHITPGIITVAGDNDYLVWVTKDGYSFTVTSFPDGWYVTCPVDKAYGYVGESGIYSVLFTDNTSGTGS